MRRLTRRLLPGLLMVALVALVAVVSACEPAQPSAGRGTPVRRVLVMGDSITFGLYGTTPRVHASLTRLMADRGVAVRVDGYPGETPIDTWPGNPRWADRMRWWIAAENPDIVVIQTMLMPSPDDRGRQAAYRAAIAELMDVARSRGAHVYTVAHPAPPVAAERHAMGVAQRLQAEAAASRGISQIPVDWWLAHCDGQGFTADGWHLSGKGQECHATAIALAVDQLRRRNG